MEMNEHLREALKDGADALRYRAEKLAGFQLDGEEYQRKIQEFRDNATILDACAEPEE